MVSISRLHDAMERVNKSHVLGAAILAALLHWWALSFVHLNLPALAAVEYEVLFVEIETEPDFDPRGTAITNDRGPSSVEAPNALSMSSDVSSLEDRPEIEKDVAPPQPEMDDVRSFESATQPTRGTDSSQEFASKLAEPAAESDLHQRNPNQVDPAESLAEPSTATALDRTEEMSSEATSVGQTTQVDSDPSGEIPRIKAPILTRDSPTIEPRGATVPTTVVSSLDIESFAPRQDDDLVSKNQEAVPNQKEARTVSDVQTLADGGQFVPAVPSQSTRRGIQEYAFVWAETGESEVPEALTQLANVPSALSEITVKEEVAWKKRCTNRPDTGTCEIVQEVFLRKNIDGETYNIGRLLQLSVSFEVSENLEGRPYLSIQLPLGVDLRPGVVIKVDSGMEIPLQYLKCTGGGCRVGRALDDDLLLAMHHGAKLFVGFRPWGGSRTNVIPASLEGFDESLKSIE